MEVARQEARGRILDIEDCLMREDNAIIGDSDVCELTHTFAEGCCVREIKIPADSIVVGKIHRHSHPNFLMKGAVSVLTESGGVEHLIAPCHMVSEAGTKRALYTHTDCEWVTIHVTEETDLDKIEEHVIAPDYNDKQLNENQIKALENIR